METKFKKFANIKGVLSQEQMKQVIGGYVNPGDGTCGYQVTVGGQTYTDCGVNKSIATSMASQYGGNWCCDSCGSSSYCGN